MALLGRLRCPLSTTCMNSVASSQRYRRCSNHDVAEAAATCTTRNNLHLIVSPSSLGFSFAPSLHPQAQGFNHKRCPRIGNMLFHDVKPGVHVMTRLHRGRLECARLHTWGVLKSQAEPAKKKSKDSKSSGGEYGSVLTQFVGKAQEPKQVTVSTKGQ